MFRRDGIPQPAPGAIIAEFDCGEDAQKFVRYVKDDTFTITPGVNRCFAVRKRLMTTLSQMEPIEAV